MEQMGLSTRRQGFMLALDTDHFSPDFMKPFLQECPNSGGPERVFRHADSEDDFGTFVSMPSTEYELAWLLLSGKKLETFREVDELVAIVYDGLYRSLESHTFAVESDCRISYGARSGLGTPSNHEHILWYAYDS